MFLKRILPVFLLLVWGAVFSSICAAAPLMIEKNLFSNDRKPPPPESADASLKPAKPGMALANIQLDGVMIQSNSKKAVLRMKSQPGGAAGKKGEPASPFVTVREGQIVSDYRVSKIESKSISLEKDGETFTDRSYRCKQSGYATSSCPRTRYCRASAGCAAGRRRSACRRSTSGRSASARV